MKLSSSQHDTFDLFRIYYVCLFFFLQRSLLSICHVYLGGCGLCPSLNSYTLKIFVLFICLHIVFRYPFTQAYQVSGQLSSHVPFAISMSCKFQIQQAFLPHYVYNKLHIYLSDPDYKYILFRIFLSPCMLITYFVYCIISFILWNHISVAYSAMGNLYIIHCLVGRLILYRNTSPFPISLKKICFLIFTEVLKCMFVFWLTILCYTIYNSLLV